jgi:hypothetical protein
LALGAARRSILALHWHSQVLALQADLFQVRSWPLQVQHAGVGGVVEIFVQPLEQVSLSTTLALGVGGLSAAEGCSAPVSTAGSGVPSTSGSALPRSLQAKMRARAMHWNAEERFFIVRTVTSALPQS